MYKYKERIPFFPCRKRGLRSYCACFSLNGNRKEKIVNIRNGGLKVLPTELQGQTGAGLGNLRCQFHDDEYVQIQVRDSIFPRKRGLRSYCACLSLNGNRKEKTVNSRNGGLKVFEKQKF